MLLDGAGESRALVLTVEIFFAAMSVGQVSQRIGKIGVVVLRL